jgi:hypothetical protein
MAPFDAAPPADDRSMEALLRDRRYGPPTPDDATPWDFVRRWPDAVVRDLAWPVVSRLLDDDDALVRVRAIEFVRDWSEGAALTVPRLLDVAERHPDRFGDQAVEGVPIRHTLAHALSNRADAGFGPRVAAMLRKMSAGALVGGGAASVLGRYEPAFVIGEVQRRTDADADWIEEAGRSLALFRRDEVIPFLTALRALEPATRERIFEAVRGYIKRDDAVAGALAKNLQLPPPKRPAPSDEECRRAIGLT